MRVDLSLARNLLGPLDPDLRRRVELVIECPCIEHWEDAHGILLAGFTSLWNAVRQVDPTFPAVGRTTTTAGDVVKEWERVPDRETLVQAINWATH